MGFESYGPQFEEAGIQHFAMSGMGEINDY
jgi:hypothetical protein